VRKRRAQALPPARTTTPAQPSARTFTLAQPQGYAMAEAIDIYGTTFKNGSVTLLARIVDASGQNIQRADLSTIKYTVYLLDDQDPDNRTAVADHADVALTVSAVIFDTLQTDSIWTVDATGYNFRHLLDISVHPAFTVAGRRYLVEYQLAPVAGQVILVRFRLNVI
jgi:hypothetical protein